MLPHMVCKGAMLQGFGVTSMEFGGLGVEGSCLFQLLCACRLKFHSCAVAEQQPLNPKP